MATDSWGVVGTLCLLGLVSEGAVAITVGFWPHPKPEPLALGTAYCGANISGVTCAFTNTFRMPAAGQCVTATLVPRTPGAKPVTSPVVCSGEVAPRETKTVALSLGWRVVDACQDAQGRLDWDACDLRIDGVP